MNLLKKVEVLVNFSIEEVADWFLELSSDEQAILLTLVGTKFNELDGNKGKLQSCYIASSEKLDVLGKEWINDLMYFLKNVDKTKYTKTLKNLSEEQLLDIAKLIEPQCFSNTISGKWKFSFVPSAPDENEARVLRNKHNDYSFDFDHDDNQIRVMNYNTGDYCGYVPIPMNTYYKVIEKLKSFGCDIEKMYG